MRSVVKLAHAAIGVAALLLITSSCGPNSVDPCSVLSGAQVEVIIGQLIDNLPPQPMSHGPWNECAWAGQEDDAGFTPQVYVQIDPKSDDFDSLERAEGPGGAVAVADLGENAFEAQDGIFVQTQNGVLNVEVDIVGYSETDSLTSNTTLAREALTRLYALSSPSAT